MPARRPRGCSSHRDLDRVRLSVPSQPHSTGLPSPKRYDNRYDDRFLSREERTFDGSPTMKLSDVCLYPQNRARIFRGGVQVRALATHFL
jgi:hypothetical protein